MGEQERWAHVRVLFDQAVELSGPARDDFIRIHCNSDLALEAELRALLDADVGTQDAHGLRHATPANYAAIADRTDEAAIHARIGQQLGAYRLESVLGVGGMGAVYRAVRTDGQFDRAVAIKLIRRALAAADLMARFAVERAVLAQLDHPHIARLLDAGMSAAGEPYLVLELVDGTPLHSYCDTHQLDIDARLDLFLSVAGAVEHAHQRLVVHRDLKPSNILVTTDGQAKLLDFGIAKLLQAGTATSHDTAATAERLLTPDYASPEQLRGEAVTTVTDVYLLGIVLYELLTGHRLCQERSHSLYEREQWLATGAIVRPSQRVLAADDADAVAARRGLSPARLSRRLRGDLDAIVLKALRPEAGQRYASVAAMADDLRAHRQARPVLARRGGWRYRAARFLRRHALASALAAATAAALVLGLGTALWQAENARREAVTSRQAVAFLVEAFRLSDPENTRGDTVTAQEILQRGAERIGRSLQEAPQARFTLQMALAESFLGLGLPKQAIPLAADAVALQESLPGQDATELGRALVLLDVARGNAGEPRDNLALADRALALEYPDTEAGQEQLVRAQMHKATRLASLTRYDDAEPLYRAAFQRQLALRGKRNPEDLITFSALLNGTGRSREAETFLREAVATLRADPDPHPHALASTLASLGTNLTRQQRAEESVPLYEEALALKTAVFGEKHPSTLITMGNLGRVMVDLERPEAEALLRKAIALSTEVRGAGHPNTAASQAALARFLADSGRAAEALPLWMAALASAEKAFGSRDGATGISAVGLGRAYLALGRAGDAEPVLRKAVTIYEALGRHGEERLARARVEWTRAQLEIGAPPVDCATVEDAWHRLERMAHPDAVAVAYASAVAATCRLRRDPGDRDARQWRDQARTVLSQSSRRAVLEKTYVGAGPP
ncbi:serine/threonine-protein kinase [Tahibacter amnicola]|uniref:Serine/threonine-protein kinase n=1 Tax=Tahibacter amnicola TaxID=2976241 RepID=A0ABY6BF29_9GAMM|nr:serine/threonine-protein kinase [Tahibacter amnicola]UXI68122.1 serine/threonine-protein kinase [Tahibacter amnicola]